MIGGHCSGPEYCNTLEIRTCGDVGVSVLDPSSCCSGEWRAGSVPGSSYQTWPWIPGILGFGMRRRTWGRWWDSLVFIPALSDGWDMVCEPGAPLGGGAEHPPPPCFPKDGKKQGGSLGSGEVDVALLQGPSAHRQSL